MHVPAYLVCSPPPPPVYTARMSTNLYPVYPLLVFLLSVYLTSANRRGGEATAYVPGIYDYVQLHARLYVLELYVPIFYTRFDSNIQRRLCNVCTPLKSYISTVLTHIGTPLQQANYLSSRVSYTPLEICNICKISHYHDRANLI
jgi:hypothetical protein